MSAGTRNFDQGNLLRANRDERRPIQIRPHEKLEGDRLRIIRADVPASMTHRLLDDSEDVFYGPRRSANEDLSDDRFAEPLPREEEDPQESIPPREPGVDLAVLHPNDIDAVKLAAFMQEVPAAGKGHPLAIGQNTGRKAVAMPLAKTDLEQIFQMDKVCMVARPQGNPPTPPAEALPETVPPSAECVSIPVQSATLPAECVSIPVQKAAPPLDKTRQYLVDNWPKLPPHVQAAILNVIEAAVGPDDE
jgi:hypothetical protein